MCKSGVEKNNLQDVIAKNEREAAEAMMRPFARSPIQLQLFEAFCEQNSRHRANPKNEYGYTLAEETYARLRACGHNRTHAWRLSHPTSMASDATAWSKASKLDKQDKVQARILYWKKRIEAESLMSTTELFTLLGNEARRGGKDGIRALELIGKIHGVFRAEKDLPGSADNPLVIKSVRFSELDADCGGNKTSAEAACRTNEGTQNTGSTL